jgi:hypothetical protein
MTDAPDRIWPMQQPALRLAERLQSTEILKIDNETAALIYEQDGVDYILTMLRCPKQKVRQ